MKCIAVALLFLSTFVYGESRRYSGIEFSGFRTIPERTIVTSCGIKKEGNAIIADAALIKSFLAKERYVKSFSIDEGKKISVTIEERESVMRLCVVDKRNYFAELSDTGKIISSGTIYSDKPLLIINRTSFNGNGVSEDERAVIRLLLTETGDNPLIRELSEIDLTDPQKAVLIFKNRRTRFVALVNPSSLQRIAALLGYFDKAAYYPETVNIIGDSAVLH